MFNYQEFVKKMIGFYVTFPEERSQMFKINFKDYGINEDLLSKIGEQFKQTKWYEYFWKKSRYDSFRNLYHSTEISTIKDDEIKGKKFNPYNVNISEYTMKNSEVI